MLIFCCDQQARLQLNGIAAISSFSTLPEMQRFTSRITMRHYYRGSDLPAVTFTTLDDDALIWPPAIAADLRAHAPDLYGGVEYASYQRPARYVPSDMLNWGGTFQWALHLATTKPGTRTIGPFAFQKGPMVMASRRAVQRLVAGSCLDNWEYRVKNKRRLASQRLHDDVTFGLFTWHCLNATRLRLLDLSSTSFVEFRRWHSYPPDRAAVRVVHLGYVLKPAHIARARLRAAEPAAGTVDAVPRSGPVRISCPDSVWANMSRQSSTPLPVSCASCSYAWGAASDVQPAWTCCQNTHSRLDLGRPASWVSVDGCAAAL